MLVNAPRGLGVRSPAWFDRSLRRPSMGLAWLALAVVLGCTKDSASDRAGPAAHSPQAQAALARQWLERVRNRYATATHYHDDARLILRYRLDGRPIEEHQLWALDYERPHRLAARLFNTRIQADSERASVAVFDYDSRNMDDQMLMLSPSLESLGKELFDDPICRHFVSGASEIPLAGDLNDPLLPPTIALLCGGSGAEWLLAPDEATLVLEPSASQSPQTDDVRLALRHAGQLYELWIDPKSELLRRVTLPPAVLEPAVFESPQVSGVQLFVQFDGAQLAPRPGPPPFSTKIPVGAHPVTRFVPLPDPFPSQQIGSLLAELPLFDARQQAIVWRPTPQTTTVIVWLDGQSLSEAAAGPLKDLGSQWDAQGIDWVVLWGDYRNPSDAAERSHMIAAGTQWLASTKLATEARFDLGMKAARQVGVELAPHAVVIGPEGRVHYVRSLIDETWRSELAGAATRVARGDDLANEMRREYEKFLERYHQQVLALHPDPPIADSVARNTGHEPAESGQTPTPAWRVDGLASAGNLAELGEQILVLDGWQTAVQLQPPSDEVRRHAIPVDAGQAITHLLGLPRTGGCLGYALSGSDLRRFDVEWNSSAAYRLPEQATLRQVDVIREDAGVEQLWLLDSRGVLRQLEVATLTEITRQELAGAVSFARLAEPRPSVRSRVVATLIVDDLGRLAAIDPAGSIVQSFEFDKVRIVRLARSQAPDLAAFAVALSRSGDWLALGLDRSLNVAWSVPIGPQDFETPLEAVSRLHALGVGEIWCVAGSDHSATVLTAAGKPIARLNLPESLRGVLLRAAGSSSELIASHPSSVAGYALPVESEAAGNSGD